jgi:hypothetical protein
VHFNLRSIERFERSAFFLDGGIIRSHSLPRRSLAGQNRVVVNHSICRLDDVAIGIIVVTASTPSIGFDLMFLTSPLTVQ